jgi:PAS domain S-box-containing protein
MSDDSEALSTPIVSSRTKTTSAAPMPAMQAVIDEPTILQAIVEGTVRNTGADFFRSLVRHLARAIDIRHAFVAEFAESPTRVRTLAYWVVDRIAPDIEWDLKGTPCEEVIAGKLCHHIAGVWQKFPEDKPLVEMRIESYLGVPLLDDKGKTLGHLAVFDDRPMNAEIQRLYVFQIFAQRAAAELQRLRMETKLSASERQFRDLFEEAPIPYVYEDTETRFLSANRAFMQLLGLKPDDVPGTYGLSLVAQTPETQERVHDSLAAEQAGREKPVIELELRRKDNGRPVWVQRWSRPEPDGKHTRTMIIDITERVLAQREKARLQQQNQYLQEEIKAEYNFEEIIGNSASLRKVLKQVEQVARTDSTVLILGETGTGKELIARAIHSRSKRKDRPLIKLNCASLPTGLVESELFGHEKGAFTGAIEKRVGRFALANGGTIFLDEIGEMPADVQVKLLRVLQEQEFEPVGSTKTVKVDVRVIAATNRDLSKAVADATFRADLFYRLNVFPISVPPLRDRKPDIPLLVHYFVNKYAGKIGRAIEEVTQATLDQLLAYPWPGNIRELENIIERAIILTPGPILEIEPDVLRGVGNPPSSVVRNSSAISSGERTTGSEQPTLADAERRQIIKTLEQTRWVVEGPHGAARILGLHPNTLRSRMKKLDIRRSHYQHDMS